MSIINTFSIENNDPKLDRITLNLIEVYNGYTYEIVGEDYNLDWIATTKEEASKNAMMQYSGTEWGMEIIDSTE